MTIVEMISALSVVQDDMSNGDRNFFQSLASFYAERGSLSGSQLFHLERLAAKYNEEELAARAKFAKSYSDEHRRIAFQVANYYDKQFPRYFGNIVDVVMKNPESHVLTFGQWNKMCENKYAKRIREEYKRESRFVTGDFVQIRANNRVDLANHDSEGYLSTARRAVTMEVRNKTAMILRVNAKPITRPAKGARIYQILLIDEGSPIYAHESDLKNARRKKK